MAAVYAANINPSNTKQSTGIVVDNNLSTSKIVVFTGHMVTGKLVLRNILSYPCIINSVTAPQLFKVTQDECSGHTLKENDTCAVTYTYLTTKPAYPGPIERQDAVFHINSKTGKTDYTVGVRHVNLKHFVELPLAANGNKKLISAYVRAAYATPDGQYLYVATADGVAVGTYDGHAYQWRTVNKVDGLPSNNIRDMAVATDSSGKVTALYVATAPRDSYYDPVSRVIDHRVARKNTHKEIEKTSCQNNDSNTVGGISKIKLDGSGVYWTIPSNGAYSLSLSQDADGHPVALFVGTLKGVERLSNIQQDNVPATIDWSSSSVPTALVSATYERTTGKPVQLFAVNERQFPNNSIYSIDPDTAKITDNFSGDDYYDAIYATFGDSGIPTGLFAGGVILGSPCVAVVDRIKLAGGMERLWRYTNFAPSDIDARVFKLMVATDASGNPTQLFVGSAIYHDLPSPGSITKLKNLDASQPIEDWHFQINDMQDFAGMNLLRDYKGDYALYASWNNNLYGSQLYKLTDLNADFPKTTVVTSGEIPDTGFVSHNSVAGTVDSDGNLASLFIAPGFGGMMRFKLENENIVSVWHNLGDEVGLPPPRLFVTANTDGVPISLYASYHDVHLSPYSLALNPDTGKTIVQKKYPYSSNTFGAIYATADSTGVPTHLYTYLEFTSPGSSTFYELNLSDLSIFNPWKEATGIISDIYASADSSGIPTHIYVIQWDSQLSGHLYKAYTTDKPSALDNLFYLTGTTDSSGITTSLYASAKSTSGSIIYRVNPNNFNSVWSKSWSNVKQIDSMFVTPKPDASQNLHFYTGFSNLEEGKYLLAYTVDTLTAGSAPSNWNMVSRKDGLPGDKVGNIYVTTDTAGNPHAIYVGTSNGLAMTYLR